MKSFTHEYLNAYINLILKGIHNFQIDYILFSLQVLYFQIYRIKSSRALKWH